MLACLTLAALTALTAACSSPPPPGPQPPEGLTEAELEAAETLALDVRGLSLERAEALIAAAEAHAAAPGDVDVAIWHGRQLAYVERFDESIRVYSAAIDDLEARVGRLGLADEATPRVLADAGLHRLLRHRGHRFITTRRFDLALVDLARAARLAELVPDRVERDGLPNAAGIPRSTSHTNIHYHLGLASLLLGRIADARDAWRTCLELAPNDDMRVAAAWWLHCCELRMGDPDAAAAVLAPISRRMDVLENDTYLRLLLWARGELSLEELTGGAGAVPAPASVSAPAPTPAAASAAAPGEVEVAAARADDAAETAAPAGTAGGSGAGTAPESDLRNGAAARPSDVEVATIAGGIGLRLFGLGERAEARRWFSTARNRSVNAFGAIVAETELSRMSFGR